MPYDASKTLDELEGVVWGSPTYDSRLVQTCHRLRTKPVQDFEIEDLRIMIGQKIGLEYLIPLALIRLEENPWAEGMMYEGDLLCATLKCGVSFWRDHDVWRKQLEKILYYMEEAPKSEFSEYVFQDILQYRKDMAI